MEHSPPVRKARANVVSIVAKYAVPSGEWPDLFPFLFQCSQSVQEDHRQICMLFYSSACRMRLAAVLELLPSIGSFLEFTHDGNEVQPYSPPQDRAMVVACLAEVPQIPQNMGSPIASYVDVILLLFS
ncbi:importin beta-4 [Spatholobus suberectus]|nr:importin beta-4 [Spatholobus suberectus]